MDYHREVAAIVSQFYRCSKPVATHSSLANIGWADLDYPQQKNLPAAKAGRLIITPIKRRSMRGKCVARLCAALFECLVEVGDVGGAEAGDVFDG